MAGDVASLVGESRDLAGIDHEGDAVFPEPVGIRTPAGVTPGHPGAALVDQHVVNEVALRFRPLEPPENVCAVERRLYPEIRGERSGDPRFIGRVRLLRAESE